jgi:hypothetical protein
LKVDHRIPGFILAALFALVAMAYADTTIYNKNYNVQGYKKESGETAWPI